MKKFLLVAYIFLSFFMFRLVNGGNTLTPQTRLAILALNVMWLVETALRQEHITVASVVHLTQKSKESVWKSVHSATAKLTVSVKTKHQMAFHLT